MYGMGDVGVMRMVVDYNEKLITIPEFYENSGTYFNTSSAYKRDLKTLFERHRRYRYK